MPLKVKITKAEHTALADVLQPLYKADKEGDTFSLETEGGEDTGALTRALDREREAVKKLKADLAKAEKDDEDAKKAAGNVEALEKSWKAKNAELDTKYQEQLKQRDGEIHRLLVDSTAVSLAAELSDSPEVLMPHIKSRLAVELGQDGKYLVRVLDNTGKPSAATPKDLAKEFVDNKAFAGVVRGSRGSGGGAPEPGSGGGAPGTKAIDFKKSSPGQIAAQLKAQGKIPGGG